jgi:Xaa-Pro aminopeptidase
MPRRASKPARSSALGTLSKSLAHACVARQTRLRKQLADRRLDALLVTNPKDTRYLSGFFSKDCLLLVLRDGAVLISDVRDEAAMQVVAGTGVADLAIGIQHRLPITVRDLCRKRGVVRLGLQAEHLTLAARASYAEQVGEEGLTATTGLVGELRMVKDAVELATIEQAIAIHEAALASALPQLRPGMTELEFCALLEYDMRRRGAEGTSFSTMVASGQRSHVIHYATSTHPITPGVLLVDMGAVYNGYCSDMTRTFGLGAMPAAIRDIYAIVLEAQLAAIDAVQPGVTCAQVDAVARNIITEAGYGEAFGHGLGHGFGLDIHENPRFNQLSTTTVLEPGMVMTVEPGIYLPGVGGVRIEDDIVVTDDGCRVLTSFPKGLDDVTLAFGESGRRKGKTPPTGRKAKKHPPRSTAATVRGRTSRSAGPWAGRSARRGATA